MFLIRRHYNKRKCLNYYLSLNSLSTYLIKSTYLFKKNYTTRKVLYQKDNKSLSAKSTDIKDLNNNFLIIYNKYHNNDIKDSDIIPLNSTLVKKSLNKLHNNQYTDVIGINYSTSILANISKYNNINLFFSIWSILNTDPYINKSLLHDARTLIRLIDHYIKLDSNHFIAIKIYIKLLINIIII